MLGAIDALLTAAPDETADSLCIRLDATALGKAATTCRAFTRLEERGLLDALLARYATLRQYLPAFFELPFQAAAGSEPLLVAVARLAR